MRETLTSVDIQLEQAGERHVVDNSMAHLRLPSAPRESPGGRLGWNIRHPQPDREDSSSSRRNYDYTRGTQTGTQNDSVPAAYQGGAVTITENTVLGTSNVDARFRPMVTPISYTHPDSRHGREVLPLVHPLHREAVTSARNTKWLRVQQASGWIHRSPVPKLPSGVTNSSSSGGDFYGD